MTVATRRERERQMHEAEIIAAAERIFSSKGYENASMDEIAAEAQFSKRTLYLYFDNKEDLFFAAALQGFTKLSIYLHNAAEQEQNGFRKLQAGSKAYYRFSREFPQAMRMIGEIGQVKKKAKADSQRLKDLMQIDNSLFAWVAQSLDAGKADGSIRNDLDSIKAAFSIIFIMTGFYQQLCATGETFMSHFSLDPEDFCQYSMDLLFQSIRGST